MRTYKALLASMFLVAAVAIPALAPAAPPKTMALQGYLTGPGGTPVNGNVQVVFKLYTSPVDPTAIWTETQSSVAVAGGVYNVTLGSVTAINLPFDIPYYLGITVGTDAEMVPRQPLASVGYAFRASYVESGAFTGNIALPNSTGSTGSINLGGQSFLHNYGGFNTFLGASSGNYALTGIDLTAVGYSALKLNTGGSNNTAVGSHALAANTSGPYNTALGSRALEANTVGALNTAIGGEALLVNTTSSNNTAVGTSALSSYTGSGGNNTAIGRRALFANVTGNNNIAIGADAGDQVTGTSNIVIGNRGLPGESYAIRIGDPALHLQTIIAAVRGNTTSLSDGVPVLIDSNGQLATASASSRTYLGYLAGNPAATGASLVAIGSSALAANAAGDSNTAVGDSALAGNTSGHSNTAVGRSALAVNNGTVIGNSTRNTAVGRDSMALNTTGADNTAVGAYSLAVTTSGSDNAAFGGDALRNAVLASGNTALGRRALFAATGNNNIGIGFNGGQSLTTGTNNIAIGHAGVAAESSTTRLGTAGTQTRAFISGIRNVTTGVNDAIAVLIDSNGQLGTASSSARVKDAIADMGDASAALMRLRPVTFRYTEYGPESRLQYGLIAEEVEQVYPGLVTKRADGSAETVMYQFLPPMLLNEVQRQQRTIERQAGEIAELKRAVAELLARR